MLFPQRPVAVSALQDFQSKKNGGAVALMQLRQGGAASLGLRTSSTWASVLSPGLRNNFLHALKALSLEELFHVDILMASMT
jgi:hypothetical protein